MKRAIFKTISLTLVITHLFTVCLRDIAWAKQDKSDPPPSAEAPDVPIDSGDESDGSRGKAKQKGHEPDESESSQTTTLASAAALDGGSAGSAGFNLASFKNLQNDPFTGRATFSVPVAVPPGRKGMQPVLALSYTSTLGNGISGVGWSLELGSIERSTKRGVPKYTSADTFIFNSGGASSELVNIGGMEYRAKIEASFMKFSFDGTSWKVWDKAGTCYFFGSSSSSRQEKTASEIYSWRLDKVSDVFGNCMLISYVKDQNQIYPLKIEYTGNEAKGDLPKYKVEFSLEARTDLNINYRSGIKVTTAKRLKEISITYNSALVRKYLLAYQDTASSSRSLLASVTQVGSDGVTSLPPITFSYQAKQASFEAPARWEGVIANDGWFGWGAPRAIDDCQTYVELMDINGDGLADRVMRAHHSPYDHFDVQLNNGSSFDPIIRWEGVYAHRDNWVWGGPRDHDSEHVFVDFIDINADGLPDRVMRAYDEPYDHFDVQLNNGSGFDPVIRWEGVMARINHYSWGAPRGVDRYHTFVDLVDINGDGLVDRVMRAESAPYDHFDVQLNNGSSFEPIIRWEGVVAYYVGYAGNYCWGSPRAADPSHTFVDLADINGDGLPDRVMRAPYGPPYDHFDVQLNNGSGFDPVIRWNGVVAYDQWYGWGAPRNADGSQSYVVLMDINGDGLADRVMRAYGSPYDHFDIQINNGTGFNPVVRWEGVYAYQDFFAWGAPRGYDASQVYAELADIDGDGLLDRVMRSFESPYDHFNVQKNSGVLPDLLSTINNGIGGSIQITYQPSTRFTNTGADGKPDLPFSVPVVTAITSSDGQGNSYTTTYEYKDGLYSWQEREFRGFGYVKAIDAEGSYSETYFKQDDIYKGRPYLQQTKDNQGNLYTKSESTWNYTQPYAGVYFPYIAQTDKYIYDGDETYKQTRARFEYDAYGNPTQVISDGEVGITGDEKTQVSEYTYNTAKWLLAFPKHTYLLDTQGTKVSEKWFYYDNAASIDTAPVSGLLTKEEVLVKNPITQQSSKAATRLSYDAYGNLKTTIDALGRTTTTIYEVNLNIFPIKVINALGHIMQSTYNYATGQVLTTTDPNNQVARNIYDCLGRLIKVIGPKDTESYPGVSYEYQLSTFPIRITKHVKADYATAPNYLTSYEFSDGLGRSIQSKSPAEPDPQTGAQRQIISGETAYDSRGQVKEQYLPYFAPASAVYVSPTYATPHASFTYDPLGRLVQQTNPDSTNSRVTYADWQKIITDENGHLKAEYYDAYGRIIKIEEHNQGQAYSTTYTYDTLGNLVKVTDNQGNISQIWYDSLGRKIKMDDPDMGVWTYEYDALGNLIKQTDALAQTLFFDYDALNRLTCKRTGAQIRTTYIYDDLVKGNCIGRLSKIIDLSGSTEFFYDTLGREIKSTKTVSGSGAYTVERTYDALDRLLTLKYPDGEILTYTYNPQGIESIEGLSPQGTVPYVSNINYSPTGQLTKVNYGNGAETDYAYDPNTLRLTNLITQTPSGKVQDLTYQFDNVGNIKQIGDYVNTATQDFTYDDLNRLIQANGAYGTFAYAYDSIGNMLQKEGVGLAYGKNGKLPHAVTQYGTVTIDYDANGNMIQKGLPGEGGLSLSYDVENRLLSVNKSGTITSFTYDGDGGRVRKITGASSTIYIGSLFEKDQSGKTTKYIFAGVNRIASRESTGGTYYFHSDHLGSSNVVTNASADQVGFTEFTPYGSTFAQTGTYNPKHKFTGKELDSTGLYFYGARYYDPQLGRFTSADTIVQAPYDSQSLNRYSYCRNNPINYIDPSGHSWKSFWKKVGDFFSGIGKAIAHNPGAFVAGIAVGVFTAWAIGPMISGLHSAMLASGEGVTFWEGFVLGGMEIGIPSFTGTLAGGLAGGEKFSTALQNAAIVGGATFFGAGLIEATHTIGLHPLHFQPTQESNRLYSQAKEALETGKFNAYSDFADKLMDMNLTPPGAVLQGKSSFAFGIKHSYLVAAKDAQVKAMGFGPAPEWKWAASKIAVPGVVRAESAATLASSSFDVLTWDLAKVTSVWGNMDKIRFPIYELASKERNCYGWTNAVLKESGLPPIDAKDVW